MFRYADRVPLLAELLDQRQPPWRRPRGTARRRGSASRGACAGRRRCTCGLPTTPLGHFEDGVDVEAELDALDAGVGLGVRLGRQVRVDAQGDRGDLAHRLGPRRPRACSSSSLSTLNRKTSLFEAVAHLGVGLADAGEDDLVAGAAGLEGAVQLAAAGHVEAGAVLGHEPAEAEVAVGLDAVADERVGRGERRLELRRGGAAAWPCCRRTAACRTARPGRGRARPRSAGCGRGSGNGP